MKEHSRLIAQVEFEGNKINKPVIVLPDNSVITQINKTGGIIAYDDELDEIVYVHRKDKGNIHLQDIETISNTQASEIDQVEVSRDFSNFMKQAGGTSKKMSVDIDEEIIKRGGSVEPETTSQDIETKDGLIYGPPEEIA